MEPQVNTKNPIEVGDLIRITTKDPKESKVHGTPFEGVVISLRGDGTNKTFTVRKIATDHVSVERIFPLNSPYIQNMRIIKKNKVRRAKLYFLRDRRDISLK